jgi:hypothetical protein
MTTHKLKMILAALSAVFLIAACGDEDDNNNSNNGTTNNGTPTDTGSADDRRSADDTGSADDSGTSTSNDNDTGTSPDSSTSTENLPTSFINNAEQARDTAEAYFSTFCDCYTDELFDGDRSACESTFQGDIAADPTQPNQCEVGVFNQYQDEFSASYDCLNREMSEANQCLSSCPSVSELSACAEGLESCDIPQEVTDALAACQDG